MSHICTSTPAPDPDAQLVTVCAAFRRDLAAYATALTTFADLKPSEITASQVRASHHRTDELYKAIEAAARVIEETPAIGAIGRGAKIMALHGYMKTMAIPGDEAMELSLAMSIITDFSSVRRRIN